MVIFQKIDKLLAVEIISLTFVITSGVSSIMLMAKIPKYAEFLFSTSHVFTSFLMLILFSFPSILKLTLPISLLLACSIVTMRMSADRELEAWMSCGVSIIRLSFMPCLLGVAVMFVSLSSALFFEPYSNKQFVKFKWLQTRGVVESFVKLNLKEKAFIYDFPIAGDAKLAMYFGSVNSKKTNTSRVFIAFAESNQKYSSIVVAKTGEFSKELVAGYPDYIFKLQDGFIYSYQEGKESLENLKKKHFVSHYVFPKKALKKEELALYPAPSDWTVTQYSNLNISLVSIFKDKFKLESGPQNQMDQLYPKEYFVRLEQEKAKSVNWRKDESVIDKLLFFLKQISIPVSTVFLPIIGVCLGILDPRKKQISVYFGIGLVIFALYSSISVCQQLALKFLINPYFMLIVTPFILIFILIFLIRWRSCYPPSCGFFEFLRNDLEKGRFLIMNNRSGK